MIDSETIQQLKDLIYGHRSQEPDKAMSEHDDIVVKGIYEAVREVNREDEIIFNQEIVEIVESEIMSALRIAERIKEGREII